MLPAPRCPRRSRHPRPSTAHRIGYRRRGHLADVEKGTALDHDDIDDLRRHHPAWRLLRADNAPLVLAALGKVFVEDNVRTIAHPDLVSRVDDILYALNSRDPEDDAAKVSYPRSASAYLDEWSSPDAGWLRKYYPPGADQPAYDATPAVETALTWLRSLVPAPFVGTESRLNTVVDLLRQIVFGAESDPQVRLEELHRQRRVIQEEIERVSSGQVDVLDPSGQRDRYQQFSSTARQLLADFRQVEENFRHLDRDLREKIATWNGAKGELLDVILGDQRGIADSDQGRSFNAFYDFLLSSSRQDELADLLARVAALPDLGPTDPWVRHVHHDWLDAAERTQATVRMLSEQLRRFLDDQVWLENRRVMEVLRGIETSALAVRDAALPGVGSEIAGTALNVVLPTERPLYRPRRRLALNSDAIGVAAQDADTSALYEQVHVDATRLADSVRAELGEQQVVALVDVLRGAPLEQGLAELLTYLSLTEADLAVVVDDDATDAVAWHGDDGVERVAHLPHVVFSRTVPGARAVRDGDAGADDAATPWLG